MVDIELTPDNSSEMARADPGGAREFEGVVFHGNECTYSSSSHSEDCVVRCVGLKERDGCGYEKEYRELQTDDFGYYVVPALCPQCYLEGTISGVRTKRPNAAMGKVET